MPLLACDDRIYEGTIGAGGRAPTGLCEDALMIRIDLHRLGRTLTGWHSHLPARELAPRLTAALHGQA